MADQAERWDGGVSREQVPDEVEVPVAKKLEEVVAEGVV